MGSGKDRKRRLLNLYLTIVTIGAVLESVEKLPVSLKYKNLFDYPINVLIIR